jgi:hypothetical protein
MLRSCGYGESKLQGDTQSFARRFPDEGILATREPEVLKMWDETRLYQEIQQSRESDG